MYVWGYDIQAEYPSGKRNNPIFSPLFINLCIKPSIRNLYKRQEMFLKTYTYPKYITYQKILISLDVIANQVLESGCIY